MPESRKLYGLFSLLISLAVISILCLQLCLFQEKSIATQNDGVEKVETEKIQQSEIKLIFGAALIVKTILEKTWEDSDRSL